MNIENSETSSTEIEGTLLARKVKREIELLDVIQCSPRNSIRMCMMPGLIFIMVLILGTTLGKNVPPWTFGAVMFVAFTAIMGWHVRVTGERVDALVELLTKRSVISNDKRSK